MTEYVLYAHNNSYAMTTHLLLEELRLDYRVVWFNVHKPQEFPPEFLTLNPYGRVPLLVTADGPLSESAATMVYLAEKEGGNFLPSDVGQNRAQAFQWLFFLMSTFQPEVLIQFDPQKYFPNDQIMQKRLMGASLDILEKIWKYLDDSIVPGPYFLGGRYSICDMLFVMQAIWKENQPATFDHLPNVRQLMKTVLARPAVKKVLATHDVEELSQLATSW